MVCASMCVCVFVREAGRQCLGAGRAAIPAGVGLKSSEQEQRALWITKPFVQRVSRVVGAISSLTLMFSRFWLMTAVWTVLVATIAAKKSEACPTSGVLIKTRATRADSGFPGRAGRGRGPSGPSRAGQTRLCAHSAGQAFLFPHGQCKKKNRRSRWLPCIFFFTLAQGFML